MFGKVDANSSLLFAPSDLALAGGSLIFA